MSLDSRMAAARLTAAGEREREQAERRQQRLKPEGQTEEAAQAGRRSARNATRERQL